MCATFTLIGLLFSSSYESFFLFTRLMIESWNSFFVIPSTSLKVSSTRLPRIHSSKTFRRSVALSISELNRNPGNFVFSYEPAWPPSFLFSPLQVSYRFEGSATPTFLARLSSTRTS